MKLAALLAPQSDSPHPGGAASQSRITVTLALLLILLTFAAFLPALHNGFVNFDDDVYVTENPAVLSGLTWEGVGWAFTNTFADNWHPLTWLSHMLDCQLYGAKPWGHHLTSLMLHAANAVLVMLVFYRMTGALGRSFFIAAIFAAHPLRVESVAWAAERKDVLSAFFWWLTLLCYCRYVNERSGQNPKLKLYFGLALVFFALGLMAKPAVVTLPFVLLLLDYWPLKRIAASESSQLSWPKLVIEKSPFFLLAAVSSVVTFIVQQRGGAVVSMGHLSLPERLANTFVAYVRYLGKIFWPSNLSIMYAMPHWSGSTVALSLLLLGMISLGVVMTRQRWPFLLVGWFWFLGTLVPMIGLVQVGEQSLADRYTYLSNIGVLIMLVWSADEMIGHLQRRWLGPVLGGFAIVLCIAATREQVGYWKDSETLFRHALAAKEDNFTIRIDLGNALLSKARLDEAISQFEQAVRLNPEKPVTHNRLGVALRARGRFEEAIAQFEEILKLAPGDADARKQMDAIQADPAYLDALIARYRQEDVLHPNSAATHFNWGITLCYQGKYGEATGHLEKAAALDSANPRAHYNLGIAYFHTSRLDDAIREYNAALALEPNAPKTHYRLGLALAQSGRVEEARAQFRTALDLQPGYAEAAQELAKMPATR